jgi:hypothetical protein
MSEKSDNKNIQNGNGARKKSDRSPSPNPFASYISSSPTNLSPRSEASTSASVSPRSPRFQTEYFQNGMKINGSNATQAMLTAGIYFQHIN